MWQRSTIVAQSRFLSFLNFYQLPHGAITPQYVASFPYKPFWNVIKLMITLSLF
jgi:hypothetical protein